MLRLVAALTLGLVLLSGTARAADHPAAGTWKFNFTIPTEQGRTTINFLIMLSESDKGWIGDFLSSSVPLQREPVFDKVTIKDDVVSFTLKFSGEELSFEGRISKDGKRIPGTFLFARQTLLVELTPSKLKNFNDPVAIAREYLESGQEGVDFFDAVFTIMGKAAAKKSKLEEIRALAERANKVAEKYGPRWQRFISLRIASTLADQEGYEVIALEQARQLERMLKPDDDIILQVQVLEGLAATLRKTKKSDELRPVESRLTKLLARDYAEFLKDTPIKVEEYKGRKTKSDRVVLVEMFTGTECEPCVGMELAFNALQQTFKGSEAVFLEYHAPFLGGDPLMNAHGMERLQYYSKPPRIVPGIYFNGKKDDSALGARNLAKAKYTAFREAIEDLLEKPASVNLQVSASQKGADISIKANVSDLAMPGEKVTLRFALVEDRIRYVGGTGIRYHSNVVRAFVGGNKGFALTKKSSEHSASINIDKLREETLKYLEDAAKEQGVTFPNSERPLSLKNLRVVAFVQDDATNEVLQAVQVEIEEKKE